MKGVAAQLSAKISERATEDVAIAGLFHRFTLDVIGKLTFGQDLKAIASMGSSELPSEAAVVIPESLKHVGKRLTAPIGLYKLPLIGDFLDGGAPWKKRLQTLMRGVLREARPDDGTILGKFAQKNLEENSSITDECLAGNVLTLFIAGSDTTSTTMQWMLKHLAEDQQLQEDCRKEAADVLSKDSFQTTLAAGPLLSSLFWEVLRFKGAAYSIPLRNPDKPITIDGKVCEPNEFTFVVPFHYLSTHGLVGVEPDPFTFNARRWVAEDGTSLRDLPPQILPFGFGARVCPGKDLAQLEALVCVATLLRDFHLRFLGPPGPILNVFSVTMRPSQNIRIEFTPRS